MHDFPGCRRDARNGFAATVQTVRLPPSLQVMQLDFINEIHKSVQEQIRQMPDLVAPRSFDPFSSSLRILSHYLRRMDLHVVADKTLFWPCDGGTPSWPNMEFLAVLFHIAAPSGEWYFQSPLGEGKHDAGLHLAEYAAYLSFDEEHDEEWCYQERDSYPYARCTFRVVPIDEHLAPFLDAFARAATNMPRLVEAWLWAPLSFNPEDMSEEQDSEIMEMYEGLNSGWGIVYNAPGAPDTTGNGVTTTRRIRWRVGPWSPSSELRQSFRNHLPVSSTVSACYGAGVLNGGEITAKTITYSITLDEKGPKHEGNHVESRAKGGSRTRTRRPATKRPSAKRPTAKRPATKRPGSVKRPNLRPKKTRTRKRPTKTVSKNATPTPSKPVKTKPLKTCKQLHLELEKYEQRLALTSGVGHISSHRSPRSELFARGQPKKPGTGPCNVEKFWSNDYESFGVEIKQNDSLPKNSRNRYTNETEHVLKWNTTVEFFHIYLDRKFVGKTLPSEDPLGDFKTGSSTTGAKVRGEGSYCKVWSKTWGNWPQGQSLELRPGGLSRTSFQHIADVYPSSDPVYKREEFTGLQKSLNGLKLRFFKWTEKPTGVKLTDAWKPEPRQLYDEKGTKKDNMPWLVKNDPGAALLRIRNVLGVRRYLDSDKVRKALKDVKIRLQERFDEIEKMEGSSMQIVLHGTTRLKRRVGFIPGSLRIWELYGSII
ncbi:hypothetical protein N0V90_003398 [Kalmusia sp. IMI 367209]|nr:hypothetical protein N0V90_003398 [Kalmusia sp. IMI 367209]